MGFRKWFGLFYTVKVRNISVSEEIKTIEEQDTEDNMTTLFGLMPWFRRYDTYCYSDRYNYVDQGAADHYKSMKKLDILRLPKKEVQTLDHKIKTAHDQAEALKKVEKEKICQEISEKLLTEGR